MNHNLKIFDHSDFDEFKSKGKKFRLGILTAAYSANGGHLGGAFSILDILIFMYEYVLNVDSQNQFMPTRDRLIFSKGHSCLALYACLEYYGFLEKGELDSFLKTDSRLPGHSEHLLTPGVEITTGSLGHGIGVAAGIALAEQKLQTGFKTFCILGDGECNEGSVWESFLFIKQHNLTKLVTIIDFNKQESLNLTEKILSIEPLRDKIISFGLNAIEIDGHSFNEIERGFREASLSKNPSVIIAHTIKGKGVDFMEGVTKWHYRAPSIDEYKLASFQLGAEK